MVPEMVVAEVLDAVVLPGRHRVVEVLPDRHLEETLDRRHAVEVLPDRRHVVLPGRHVALLDRHPEVKQDRRHLVVLRAVVEALEALLGDFVRMIPTHKIPQLQAMLVFS